MLIKNYDKNFSSTPRNNSSSVGKVGPFLM